MDDWQHDVATRITFGSATNIYPTWTPDGRRITYSTDEAGGKFTISWRRADGAGAEQHLLESSRRFGHAPFIVEKTTKRAGTVRRCIKEGCTYSETVGDSGGDAVGDVGT